MTAQALATERVSAYLRTLQASITGAIAELDGSAFLTDPWQKPAGEIL